ncbi:glycosyltransferase family 4 protein [Dactylosporangium sp. AC04546]|uniref:glycosyltransferase family 4 protein n=1 Tax=Dactylosporangium sp. AC04546 TaxID=2862460 RepID=UPI001EE0625F|nr:glycosyltransferase family 4 protein [Dactylosporangium sp. AC04546]WVK88722.1 glycosyltransferase family 4 protein [Dactylosporangium sp. AC04546]
MRIAHVTDVYLPRLGGVELQVHDLVTRQRAAGHDTLVVTTTPGPSGPRVVRLGGELFGAGPYRVLPGRSLADVLRVYGVDVVHAHVSAVSPMAWTAAGLAASGGRPTVVSVHSMWHGIVPLVRGYARLRSAATWPVVWAAVSNAAAAAVSEALDGTPVTVLPNGIDPAEWRLSTPPRDRGVPTIVSVMRMVRRKRPRALLGALRALRATHGRRFRAVLVGDGPLLPGLRREVTAAGLDGQVRFTGALDRDAIRRLLATADLYVAPASRESFGIAALEARSAGVPVLARAGSGVADFVRHGTEGWLVDSDKELYATIAELLDDPGRLAAVAAHNRAVAPRVDWQAVLDAADALYAAADRTPRLLGSPA